jgi:bifunctional non-homologous end joining protein LigD
MATPALTTYAAKRSFKDTPEPAPAERKGARGPLLFVVQQHSARRLHFDFRLELDGVLKSWAVPKGPAIAPGEKRLAVMTEDHPFDYGSFEGVIPPKQYGAGPVIVWDCGVYSPDEEGKTRGVYSFADREQAEKRMHADLEKGKLSFFLLGNKLKGSFALIRTKQGKDWLLIKHRDPYIDLVVAAAEKNRSVLSGLTVEEIRSAPQPPRLRAEQLVPFGPAETLPQKLLPMLAQPADSVPSGTDWLYEPKLDGYRVIAFASPEGVKLKSRKGLDISEPFPEIVAGLKELAKVPMVLDGELIALGPDGKPSFNALQNRAQLKTDTEITRAVKSSPCVLALFDLLHFAGMNLRKCAYRDRSRYLGQVFLPMPHIQRIEASVEGDALYRASLDAGFEGVVAKRAASAYEPGERSASWQKVKAVQSAEFYIGGYAEGKGSRADRFGALLLGTPVKDGKKGLRLKYCGRVGSGFDQELLDDLHRRFDELETGEPPFTEMPPTDRPTTWLKPRLVAEVKFAEWTPDGHLRAPVFLRLRDDTKPKAEVALRKAAKAEPSAEEAETAMLLAALEGKAEKVLVKVRGENVSLTNLNKVLWPAEEGFRAYTKRDYLRYLLEVSPYVMPHIADRPVTLIRMPDGIHGERFFQKHWEQPFPSFVETITVFSESKDESHEYFLCQNVPTLLWLGQVGTLEFHVWHSRANTWPEAAGIVGKSGTDYASSLESLEGSILNRPDWVVFDIDPYIYSGKEAKGAEPEYNAKAFDKGKEVAFWLKDLLDSIGLEALVKTSGKTGLHVFVPVVRTLDFGAARKISQTVSEHLRRAHPKDITTEWSTVKRTGKIFMDYKMNSRAKTLNVAYSPRGVPGAPVSMPLSWEALTKAQPSDFTMENAIGRLKKTGDAWQDALRSKQNLEALIKFWKG